MWVLKERMSSEIILERERILPLKPGNKVAKSIGVCAGGREVQGENII